MRGFTFAAYRILAALFFLHLSVPALCQDPDTIRMGNRVLIRSNRITTVIDSLELARRINSINNANTATPIIQARLQNECGVTASFSPGNDSSIHKPTTINFASTSVNATSYSWYMNGIPVSNTSSYQLNITAAGVYEVRLVARNNRCSDSTVCFYIYGGTGSNDRTNFKAHYGIGGTVDDYANTLIGTKGGGFLVGGYFHRNTSSAPYYPNQGLVIKTSETGCIEWSRSIPTTVDSRVYQTAQLSDSGYAIAGLTNNFPFLIKLDKSGNHKWSRTYRTADQRYVFPESSSITAADDGGMVFAGNFWGLGMAVVRTDASGNVVWSKLYSKSGAHIPFYLPYGILQDGADIYMTGTVISWNDATSNYEQSGFVMNVDFTSGNTKWTRKYSINNMDLTMFDICLYGSKLLVNSSPGAGINFANNSIHILERDGTPVQTTTIVTPSVPYGASTTSMRALPNGDIYIMNSGTQVTQTLPGFINHSLFIKIDASNDIKWANDYAFQGSGLYNFIDTAMNGGLVAVGSQSGTLADNSTVTENINLKRIDSTGNNNCQTAAVPVSLITTPATSSILNWTSDIFLPLIGVDTTFGINETFSEVRYVCPTEFIDSCSILKVSGPTSICNTNNTYSFKAHRNSSCAQEISWQLPAGASMVSQSGNEVNVRFASTGSFKISASLAGTCTPVRDSIIVNVESKTISLFLGRDTTICPNTTITVHAGPQFMNYQWQNGTVDSILRITIPGKYWVTVTDYCGNQASDTIIVHPSSNLIINAGPDMSKCNTDTLHLHAPTGYMSYSWSPNYNINTTAGPNVVVSPAVDTFYILKAEQTAGCFAYDTIRVSVKNSPRIDLGPDRSLCKSDNLVLDAGPGFINYRWNNGSNAQKIAITNTGFYSVAATDEQGCTSMDIMRVIALYEVPSVMLDRDSLLCEGTTRILNAGNGFASYSWSNGGTGSTMKVSAPGKYWVTVTNLRGCKAADTMAITRMMAKPGKFLPPDTAICSYGSVLLKTNSSYQSYLWSNSSTSNSISVTKPGLYWAEVTDANQCKGKDSITVYPKDCMQGFYVPNAFTPNNDGHNDLFRPLIYGNIKRYQLIIFNRWGQMIFRCHDALKGWDGTYSGADQKSNVFTWVCVYQMEGETEKTERGTVTLIR